MCFELKTRWEELDVVISLSNNDKNDLHINPRGILSKLEELLNVVSLYDNVSVSIKTTPSDIFVLNNEEDDCCC